MSQARQNSSHFSMDNKMVNELYEMQADSVTFQLTDGSSYKVHDSSIDLSYGETVTLCK